MVVFALKWLSSSKVVLFGQKRLYSVQKWLFSGRSGCIIAHVVVFGQRSFIFGQCGCFRDRKWLYSGKSGCIRVKVVVFGQKWLYS